MKDRLAFKSFVYHIFRSKASKKKDKKKGREKKSRSTSSTETEKQPTAVVGQPDFSIYPATREPQKDQPAKIEEENGLSFNQIVLIVVCASVLIYILRSRS
jgi:hypothetical protein